MQGAEFRAGGSFFLGAFRGNSGSGPFLVLYQARAFSKVNLHSACTKLAWQHRNDHGGGSRASNHSVASPIARFFGGCPQNHRKLAATTPPKRRKIEKIQDLGIESWGKSKVHSFLGGHSFSIACF